MDDIVLTLLAHPDDAEFLCAGTIIRLVRECGWRAHLATMTAGDCGSAQCAPDDISRIRRGEATAAAALIGAQFHCLEERDLLVMYDRPTLEKVTRLFREVRPRIVITHSPTDYLLDHEMTSVVARAAAFAAPVPNFMMERGLGTPLPRLPHLYYCDAVEGKDLLGKEVQSGIRIDISGIMDEKVAMLECHASQREWLRQHHRIDEYILAMQNWSKKRGELCGVSYAEGFCQHLGHGYPDDDLLGQMLGSCYR
jgi:LmbE family N-acetylglucosaminyl deacetylase